MANWTNPEYLADLHDDLWELFSNTATWLRGQYLCDLILQNVNRCLDDDLVRLAMHLSQGQWIEGAPKSSPWPCRQSEEYLMHWQPNMAFGVAEQLQQAEFLAMEANGIMKVMTGEYTSDRIGELHRLIAEASPERIAEIKRKNGFDWAA